MGLFALDLKICMFGVNNGVPGVAPFRDHPPGIPETHVVFLEHTRPHVCLVSFVSW